MTSAKRAQKFHTDDASLPRFGQCFRLVVPRGTNQKHCPYLGSDMSSVWNFCARFADVIFAGKRFVASQPAQQAFPIELLRESQSKTKVEGEGEGRRGRGRGSFVPLPLPHHSCVFCSCPSFLDEPREETLATQASSVAKSRLFSQSITCIKIKVSKQ